MRRQKVSTPRLRLLMIGAAPCYFKGDVIFLRDGLLAEKVFQRDFQLLETNGLASCQHPFREYALPFQ